MGLDCGFPFPGRSWPVVGASDAGSSSPEGLKAAYTGFSACIEHANQNVLAGPRHHTRFCVLSWIPISSIVRSHKSRADNIIITRSLFSYEPTPYKYIPYTHTKARAYLALSFLRSASCMLTRCQHQRAWSQVLHACFSTPPPPPPPDTKARRIGTPSRPPSP